jgi:branched-subunit amino acid aminotransferase/4-amino-4-deoxychorismate lyase
MRADVMDRLGGRECPLAPEDLARASEAFLTNSLAIRPLTRVDGVPLADGSPGPVTVEAMAGEEQDVYQAGGQDVLSKPYEVSDLRKKLKKWLQ